MRPAGRGSIPLALRLDGASASFETLARSLTRTRVEALLPAGYSLSAGSPVRFAALLRGQRVDGEGRVAAVREAGLGEVAVVLLDVTSLDEAGEAVLRRVEFRDRLEVLAVTDADARRVLDARPLGAPSAPDTTPTGQTAPRAPVASEPGSGTPARPRSARPRAQRHHWETADRFRLR